MSIRLPFASISAIALGAVVVTLSALPLHARTDRPQSDFPRHFGVLYATVDRAHLVQYRELYAPPAALAAVREGRPPPVGTELIMIVYAAKRDSAGIPITDGRGRFVRDELVAYLAMRMGQGDAVGGPWQYRVFRTDKQIDANARLADCAACHEKQRAQGFLFTGDQMKAAAARWAR